VKKVGMFLIMGILITGIIICSQSYAIFSVSQISKSVITMKVG